MTQILYDSFTHLQNFVEYTAQIYTHTSDNTFKRLEKGLEGIEWLTPKNNDKVYQTALNEIKVLYVWWTDLRTQSTDAWKLVKYNLRYV